jgi:hypothetical protein
MSRPHYSVFKENINLFNESPSLRVLPETHAKRQATQHGCLPSLLGDGDKENEIVYGEKKKNNLYLGRLEQPRQYKNFLYRHD